MVKVNTGELKLPGGDLNGRLVGIKSCRKRHGLVAQLAVHVLGKDEVAGSSPAETSNPVSDGRYKKSFEKTPKAACRGLGN